MLIVLYQTNEKHVFAMRHKTTFLVYPLLLITHSHQVMTIDIQENFNFDGFFYSDNGHNANSEERRVYTDKEREVIEKFKEKYLAATSASQRRNIAQLEMFPDLFNHWSSQGIVYNKAETRRKSNVGIKSQTYGSNHYLRFNVIQLFRNSLDGYEIPGGREMKAQRRKENNID